MGPGPAHGDELRRRHEDHLRAGDRRQRHRDDGRPAGHARRRPRRARRRADRRPTTSTSCARLGGVVDYVVGSQARARASTCWRPTTTRSSGTTSSSTSSGKGPLYSFYTPYHLCHFEVPTDGGARGAVRRRHDRRRSARPRSRSIATAKRDLPAGTVLDGLGGYDTYGQAERADVTAAERPAAHGRRRGLPAAAGVAKDEVAHLRRRRAAGRPARRRTTHRPGTPLARV